MRLVSSSFKEETVMKTLDAILVAGTLVSCPRESRAQDEPTEAPFVLPPQGKWYRALKVPIEAVNTIGLRMRLIPPGEFLMGTTDADIGQILQIFPGADRVWWKGEQPPHRVRVDP